MMESKEGSGNELIKESRLDFCCAEKPSLVKQFRMGI